MSGKVQLSGGNMEGNGDSSHKFMKQVNYWPDTTVRSFSVQDGGMYFSDLSVSSGSYYVKVGGRSSWTEATD